MRIVSTMTRLGALILAALAGLPPLSAVQTKSLAGTWKVSWREGNHSPQEVPPLYTLPMKDPGRPAPRVLKTGNEGALRKGR